MIVSRSAVILAAVLAVASVGPASATQAEPTFEEAACPFILPPGQVEGESVECGYVVVPEDRADPESRTIRLATAVFHPPGGVRHPDAVVYLEGGPGGSPLTLAGTLRDFDSYYGPFLETGRDLILVDQRGVGYSEPALECPAFSDLYLDLLDQRLGDGTERLSGERMRDLKVEALAECAEELRGSADLGSYNTMAIAGDVAALRRALGYEQLDLWGTSYGTWAAQAAIRDHPESIRSAILDAPVPPEADLYADAPSSYARALDEVFSACADEPACARAYPDLRAGFAATLERLDAEPVLVDILDPIRGQRVDLLIDGPTFLELVFRALYQANLRAALPRIIDDARDGAFDTVLTVAQLDVMRQDFRSWGMYFSVLCHDEVPFSSREAFEAAAEAHPELAGMYSDFEIGPLPYELCPRWDAGTAPPVETGPVESDVPVLVTTGQFDPIVPPSWGQEAVESLSAASFHVFPGLAHGASGDPCATEMMLAFLEEPGANVDDGCIASMPVATFELPSAAEVQVTLEPFSSEALGLAGMRPAGWTEVAAGQYVRRSSGTDPTSLVVAPLPLRPDATLARLTERFGLAEEPEPLTTEAGVLEWARYGTEAQGVAIDFAIAPSADATVIAVLTSSRADREHLVEAVLLPVLADLRPVSADPTPTEAVASP